MEFVLVCVTSKANKIFPKLARKEEPKSCSARLKILAYIIRRMRKHKRASNKRGSLSEIHF